MLGADINSLVSRKRATRSQRISGIKWSNPKFISRKGIYLTIILYMIVSIISLTQYSKYHNQNSTPRLKEIELFQTTNIHIPPKSKDETIKNIKGDKTTPPTTTPSPKPKLFVHVGPLKTGTTTIQRQIIGKGGILRNEDLARDDIYYGYYPWKEIFNTAKNRWWYRFFIMNNKYYAKMHEKKGIKNMLISNEAFSLANATHYRTSDAWKRLETKWDVRIIMTYRPLETWYRSKYNEDRYHAIYNKTDKDFKDWSSRGIDNVSIDEWFDMNWVSSDPLQTYETFQKIFGKEKIHVMSLDRHDGIDISVQFICEALEAHHSCEIVKKKHGEIPRENISKPKYLFEYDLLAMGAMKRGLLRNNDKCKRLERHETTLLIESHLKNRNTSLDDLPQVCISSSQQRKLYDGAWQAEQKLASMPRDKSDFDKSFQIEIAKYCSLDVDSVLSMIEWKSFFQKDDRLCKG